MCCIVLVSLVPASLLAPSWLPISTCCCLPVFSLPARHGRTGAAAASSDLTVAPQSRPDRHTVKTVVVVVRRPQSVISQSSTEIRWGLMSVLSSLQSAQPPSLTQHSLKRLNVPMNLFLRVCLVLFQEEQHK